MATPGGEGTSPFDEVDASVKATLALCTHLRGLANKLVACRSKGDGGLSKASAPTVAALTNDVAAASVTLKMEERRGLLATEACKQVVQDDKAALDQHHLQLQNLLYERNHLLREIERCKSFRTPNLDKIQLASVDEFKATAPSNLVASATAVENSTAANRAEAEHALYLSRLQFELDTRKQLAKDLADRKVRRKAVETMTGQKRKFLDALPQQLKAFEKATEPFQKYISLQLSKKVARQRKARELPAPLYVLYCQVDALSDATGHSVSVDVVPSVDGVAKAAGSKASSSTSERMHKRQRSAEGSPAPSPPPSGSGAGSAAATAPRALTTAELFAPAPQAVRVRVRKLPDQASSVNIIFQYLPELDVVTAEAVDKSLLVNLFPADTGMYTPRTSNHLHALASPTGLRIPSSLYGRPYKWAQWLCGLYMLTSPIVAPESGKVIKPHPRPEPTTRRLLDMVRARVVSRNALRRQVEALAGTPKDVAVHPDAVGALPPPPASGQATLVSWSEIRAPKDVFAFAPRGTALVRARMSANSRPPTVQLPDEDDSDQEAVVLEEHGSGAVAQEPWYQCCAKYYRAVFKSSHTYVQALAQVPAEYPVRPSRLLLTKISSATSYVDADDVTKTPLEPALQHLETMVNGFASKLTPTLSSRQCLLSHQLRLVQLKFPEAASQ